MRFKEGDYVKIIERDVTSTDLKNGTFYPYFRGLAGVVDRIYDKEICIRVDPETMPEDVLKRHLDIQESVRQKWLNGLSGEARNRLAPADKQFELAYTILVQSTDLEKIKPGEARPAAIKSARPLSPPKAAPEQIEAPQKPTKPRKAEPAAAKSTAVKEMPKPRPAKPPAVKAEPPQAKAAPKPGAVPKVTKPAPAKEVSAKKEPGKPLTMTDLEAAELEHLKAREKALKRKK